MHDVYGLNVTCSITHNVTLLLRDQHFLYNIFHVGYTSYRGDYRQLFMQTVNMTYQRNKRNMAIFAIKKFHTIIA